jgi:hypothetical protein
MVHDRHQLAGVHHDAFELLTCQLSTPRRRRGEDRGLIRVPAVAVLDHIITAGQTIFNPQLDAATAQVDCAHAGQFKALSLCRSCAALTPLT